MCKRKEDFGIPNDIQTIPIEINIRKQKWLLLPIYRSHSQDPRYFIENICAIIDRHTSLSEKVLLIGDFNMEISDQEMSILTNTYNLFNLFKGPTCFKTPKGRSIDLMLTNRKQSFKESQLFKTGFSDHHHHLIYTILKSNFVKLPPKIIRYREYKKFRVEDFQTDLDNSLRHLNYQLFHSVTETILQKHAPLKQRVIRGNNKFHINSYLRMAIMTRTRLKNRANKSGSEEDY